MKSDVVQVDNVVAKSCIFEREGDFTGRHVHKFDHMHLVAHGTVKVTSPGVEDKLYSAGEMIKIKALTTHQIFAVTDDAVSYCIHALREDDMGKLLSFDSVVV